MSDPANSSVTAVLVAHNGERWLREVIAALKGQTRPLNRVLAVDTGSRDESAELLRQELGADAVLTLGKQTGFGAAVQAAVAVMDQGGAPDPCDQAGERAGRPNDRPADRAKEWLWLIHDDSAPAPEALGALLRLATSQPDVAVVGPKLRGWDDRRLLLEAGVTIGRSGRRETGLERNEVDQGQHDDVREVLAVSTAGMLVRRDAWDRLGGFDPHLPLFRDDVDLGWRANRAGLGVVVAPDAVVHHVGAASSGRRAIDAATRRRHLLDRRSALYVLLANLPRRALPWAYVRLTAASLLRAVGFAAGKLPGAAVDELAAVLSVLARPDRVVAARRWRSLWPEMSSTEPPSHRGVAALLAPRRAQVSRNLEAVAGVFSRSSHGSADIAARGHRAVESGQGSDDLQDLEPVGLRWMRGLLSPGPLLVLSLLVLALLAARGLLGGGRLSGGALLPSPDGARDLWGAYLASWHDVGLGSAELAPPYLAVVALVATVLLGNAPLAVDVLLIGAVPLAGLTAWVALRQLRLSTMLRVWAAATYALLPATSGAVAGGRLGTAGAIVVAPLVAAGAVRARGSWPAAWATGFALAVAAALAPLSYAITVVVLGVLACATCRSVGASARLLVIALIPVALLLPWTLEVLAHPGLLLVEAGLPGPGLSDSTLPPVWVLLQSSGGPGAMPWWLGVPLVLGALAGLLSRHRRGTVLAGWVIAAVGLAGGVVISLAQVSTSAEESSVAGWPGFSVAAVAAGLLVAAAVGADSSRDRLTQRSFGWRQPVALAVALAAAAAPLLFAGWWVARGAAGPLDRSVDAVLPEFVAAQSDDTARARTVVLRTMPDGSVTYALVRESGPRLGDAEAYAPLDAYDQLDAAVADVVSGRGGEDVRVLTEHAVQYLLVAAPVDADLVAVIDAVPGLQRVSTSAGEALWRLSEPAARIRVVDDDGELLGVVASGREGARAQIPAGPPGRVAVLAEPASASWTATVDGQEIPASAAGGWAQSFELPPGGGELVVRYAGGERTRWLIVQALLIGLVLVLAVPGVRREPVG